MNFQEPFWFSTTTTAPQQQQQHYLQHPSINHHHQDPSSKPKSMMNPSSVSYSHHHNHHQDVDNEFPDHDDRHSTTTTKTRPTTQDHNNYSNYTTTDREPMFEKPLTPSDVGKLNRLVIPKQHAEKYFPLNGSGGGGGGGGETSGEKGLVLSFEDEAGKSWRFRYSYWNSSQSYVLTKGWSRFVKEKRLDAGDVVLFERHRIDLERFFIGWRRRGVGGNLMNSGSSGGAVVGHRDGMVVPPVGSGGWGGMMYYNARGTQQQQQVYPPHVSHGVPVACYQQVVTHGHDYHHPQLRAPPGTCVQHEKAPAATTPPTSLSGGGGAKNNNSKRKLRLFGVNLECGHLDADDNYSPHEPHSSDASSLSSGGDATGAAAGRPGTGMDNINPATTAYYYDYVGYPATSNHHHMDVNQMRNRFG